ncbi:MAG: hypothetical protein JWN47_803 [Frankiales bacterium]|jgi:uncharacterized protein (TIGR00725 family)|nr:hypothetical protein [Frankiales bacterium]
MTTDLRDGGPRYLGVIGPSDASEDELDLARAVGREVARSGAILLCGGRGGVMEAAAQGAHSADLDTPGIVIGILPGSARGDARGPLDYVLATGLGELRNAVLVTSCDAVIAVGGSPGTLIEMGYALKASKPLAVISGWSVVESGGSRPAGVIGARTAEAAVAAVLAALPGD